MLVPFDKCNTLCICCCAMCKNLQERDEQGAAAPEKGVARRARRMESGKGESAKRRVADVKPGKTRPLTSFRRSGGFVSIGGAMSWVSRRDTMSRAFPLVHPRTLPLPAASLRSHCSPGCDGRIKHQEPSSREAPNPELQISRRNLRKLRSPGI
jgi:hypothetical protein